MLVVNATKSNILMVTTKQRKHFLTGELEALFGSEKWQNIDPCKYMGVHVDNYNYVTVHILNTFFTITVASGPWKNIVLEESKTVLNMLIVNNQLTN